LHASPAGKKAVNVDARQRLVMSEDFTCSFVGFKVAKTEFSAKQEHLWVLTRGVLAALSAQQTLNFNANGEKWTRNFSVVLTSSFNSRGPIARQEKKLWRYGIKGKGSVFQDVPSRSA
jgi:hypothetical protein